MGDVKWEASLAIGPVSVFVTLVCSRAWLKGSISARVRRTVVRADGSLWLYRRMDGEG